MTRRAPQHIHELPHKHDLQQPAQLLHMQAGPEAGCNSACSQGVGSLCFMLTQTWQHQLFGSMCDQMSTEMEGGLCCVATASGIPEAEHAAMGQHDGRASTK